MILLKGFYFLLQAANLGLQLCDLVAEHVGTIPSHRLIPHTLFVPHDIRIITYFLQLRVDFCAKWPLDLLMFGMVWIYLFRSIASNSPI